MKNKRLFLFRHFYALMISLALAGSVFGEEGADAEKKEGEEKPKKTHVIRVPGAILVKVGDTLFQSKVGVEVVSPIRSAAFHAVNNYAPIISHKLNLAFSKLTEEQIRSPATKPELQALAKSIVVKLFEDTRQTVTVEQVIFTEYLVR